MPLVFSATFYAVLVTVFTVSFVFGKVNNIFADNQWVFGKKKTFSMSRWKTASGGSRNETVWTPYYNRAIGNVTYSRHVYGGAADIFIDENPVDDTMDDLNKDGKSDYRDAAILYERRRNSGNLPNYCDNITL